MENRSNIKLTLVLAAVGVILTLAAPVFADDITTYGLSDVRDAVQSYQMMNPVLEGMNKTPKEIIEKEKSAIQIPIQEHAKNAIAKSEQTPLNNLQVGDHAVYFQLSF